MHLLIILLIIAIESINANHVAFDTLGYVNPTDFNTLGYIDTDFTTQAVRVITKPIYVPQIIEHTTVIPEYINQQVTAAPIINPAITTTLPAQTVQAPTAVATPIVQPATVTETAPTQA